MVIRVRAESREALGRRGSEHVAWADRASRDGREGQVEGARGGERARCKQWATELVRYISDSTILDMLLKRAVNLAELAPAVPARRALLLAAHVPLTRVHILGRIHGVAARVALVVTE